MAIIRWALFLFVGLPFQLLVYLLYPLAVIYFLLTTKEVKQPTKAVFVPVDKRRGRSRNHLGLLDTDDDHGAFCMYGVLTWGGLRNLLTDHHDFVRQVVLDDKGGVGYNRRDVSGDCVVSWAFAATTTLNLESTIVFNTARRAALRYLKYLGVLSDGNYVSNRCNNFGLNYCPDGVKGIGQPLLGPQFYTTSSLLAVASVHSSVYKALFWVHWIVLGGWYWAFAPVLWTKKHELRDAQDITMKALYVHKVIFGNVWWVRIPMNFIRKRQTYLNELFEAMHGEEVYGDMGGRDAFFSQHSPPVSNPKGRINGYYGIALADLASQASKIERG